MAFRNRNYRPGRGGGGGFRPRFNDRGSVEMHKAICDNCGKECEVPFRPTSGKPIFCSNCFENQRRGSYSREGGSSPRSLRGASFAGEAGRNFERSSFEKKNDGRSRNTGTNQNGNNNQKFDQLNAKLDAILKILTPPPIQVEATKKPKASRKKSSALV